MAGTGTEPESITLYYNISCRFIKVEHNFTTVERGFRHSVVFASADKPPGDKSATGIIAVNEMQNKIFTTLSRGGLVLTANKRLARYLHENYDQMMRRQGFQVWETARILSYEAWLMRCFNELEGCQRLLNQFQEQWLWERQIERVNLGTELELLQLPQTAEQALKAHHLIKEYRLNPHEAELTEDQRAFMMWREQVENYCRKHGWIDKSDLPALVCDALTKGFPALPGEVLLVGFDDLSPSIELLRQTLINGGCPCHVAVPRMENQRTSRYAAEDQNREIESAARWARALVDQGADAIGIVVPDLRSQRGRIERIFTAQLSPGALWPEENQQLPFNFSLGRGLTDSGLIHAALKFLQVEPEQGIDELSFLLRSPFLAGSQSEADARARFDVRLRSWRRQRFYLADIHRWTATDPDLSRFSALVKLLLQAGADQHKVASPGSWAQRFAELLHAIGWPGEGTLSSAAYQALMAWKTRVLEVMGSLDVMATSLTRGQALNLLRRMTLKTDFQPETGSAPIQIVGLLESSGLQFQYLWVMGMDDSRFPARPQPNPFIAYRLQEKYNLPRVDFHRELEFAERIVDRLRNSAPYTIFSYAAGEGDRLFRPSPLLCGCDELETPDMADPIDPLGSIRAAGIVPEQLEDSQGPEISDVLVSGGISLLQDQAHCPFRAFIHHRLGGRALAEAEPGLSALERGNLVHRCLEKIWGKLSDQSHLLALESDDLEQVLQSQVSRVIAERLDYAAEPIRQLEQERLVNLLREWLLDVEAERSPFKVRAVEQQVVARIGPLQISLQVDRVDQLENGFIIIIDYKTGTSLSLEDFLSTPLIEPQLPVYAVIDAQQAADGVAFARIRKGACRFVGLISENDVFRQLQQPDLLPQAAALNIHDWSQLLLFWRQQIDQLAADFASGKAEVRPFDRQKSCRYCDLPGLCRISTGDFEDHGDE